MTYYKWIETLENLKTAPRNDNIITNLQTQKLDLTGNILYRFIKHINDTVRTRLSNVLNETIIKLNTTYMDTNAISMEIINIKKELLFCKKLMNLPIIPKENKNKFMETLQKFANEINETLEESAENLDKTGETITMIKNSKINILED